MSGTVRRRAQLVRVIGVAALARRVAVSCAGTARARPARATPTTLPGPAPNQSQINTTQSQVAQIESTLAQEEQQTSVLDDKYNTALQNLRMRRHRCRRSQTNLATRRSAVEGDKRLVANDAVAGLRLRHARDGLRVLLLRRRRR